MIKILISTEADRLAVAAALIKNGYTVRQGREKKTGGKAGWETDTGCPHSAQWRVRGNRSVPEWPAVPGSGHPWAQGGLPAKRRGGP